MYDVSGSGLTVKIAFDRVEIDYFDDMTSCILGPGKLYVIGYTGSLEIPWCLKLFPPPLFVLVYMGVGLKTANQTADSLSSFYLSKSSMPCMLPSLLVILALCHFFVAKTLFCILQELQSLNAGKKHRSRVSETNS